MAIEITMPRLSDTMESGTVLKWNVAEGDKVSSGDVVADVETDKATMELSVYDDGTMAKILVDEGQTVDVGTLIAVMAEDGEDVAAAMSGAASTAAAADGGGGGAMTAAPLAATVEDEPGRGDDEPAAAGRGRMRISPVARRLADEHELDLGAIRGSGPGGRIIKRDVQSVIATADETAAARVPTPSDDVAVSRVPARTDGPRVETTAVPIVSPVAASGEGMPAGRVALNNMRQTIAKRLVESKTTIPHYQVTMTFDMDPLLELRKMLNEQLAPMGVKLSVNDFLIRGCALSMYRHPEFNASWDGDAIVIHGSINIGVAISVGAERGGGLVVGVIRDADRKSLRTIAAESRHLAERARTRGLTVEEMSDSTFTLSNLGMFGVEHFTAIINPPNSAILAVGAAIQKPVVRDGELTVGHEMSATLSNDHRVIDGATAAQYLQTLKQYIESPGTLLV